MREYEETYRHERATWYPGFCALDWQPTDPTQQHPQFPCQPVTQEEWATAKNNGRLKMRVENFVLPAIKWMPKFVDTSLFKMMQIMTQFNLTPVCFKVYDRLAIPKAVPGTFRHIAIATDMFAVHATIIHNRLAEPLNRSCPSQIIAFLANRSAMDGNAVRQSVREDCAQALAEGQDAELLILLLDDVKMM